jgi:hypothetical protein
MTQFNDSSARNKITVRGGKGLGGSFLRHGGGIED